MTPDDGWRAHLELLGGFIRRERRLANLSLRELAQKTNISNPYLSQIERGLHEPSVRVLKAIAGALNLSAETLLAQAGLLEDEHGNDGPVDDHATENAIRVDSRLTDAQRDALLAVYRSYVAANAQ
jgi:transcriptional regulator with XRE-family HTH domain